MLYLWLGHPTLNLYLRLTHTGRSALYIYIVFQHSAHSNVVSCHKDETPHNVIVNFLVFTLMKLKSETETCTSINTILVYACLHMATHQSRMLSKIFNVYGLDVTWIWIGQEVYITTYLCVCVFSDLYFNWLLVYDYDLTGACITLIFSVCLIERSFQMAAWWPPLSSLFPFAFAQSCRGRQVAHSLPTARFAIAYSFLGPNSESG
jgi:hypothetical protein